MRPKAKGPTAGQGPFKQRPTDTDKDTEGEREGARSQEPRAKPRPRPRRPETGEFQMIQMENTDRALGDSRLTVTGCGCTECRVPALAAGSSWGVTDWSWALGAHRPVLVPPRGMYQGTFAKKNRIRGLPAPPVPPRSWVRWCGARKGCLARAIGPSGGPCHPPARPR
jgi:hypothetical protein